MPQTPLEKRASHANYKNSFSKKLLSVMHAALPYLCPSKYPTLATPLLFILRCVVIGYNYTGMARFVLFSFVCECSCVELTVTVGSHNALWYDCLYVPLGC